MKNSVGVTEVIESVSVEHKLAHGKRHVAVTSLFKGTGTFWVPGDKWGIGHVSTNSDTGKKYACVYNYGKEAYIKKIWKKEYQSIDNE
jgi:hypothetical protein